MALPADDQTEGVIITAAPAIPTPALPDPKAVPPAAASNSHLLPFGRVFRDWMLWIACFISLISLIIAYQPSFNYQLFPESPGLTLDDSGIGYSHSFIPASIGGGWAERDSNLMGRWTDGAGTFYIPNLGYVLSSSNYTLTLQLGGGIFKPIEPIPTSFTVTVGDQIVGTYPITSTVNVSIPTNAIREAGPDPVFAIISASHPSPNDKSKQLGMPIFTISLYKPPNAFLTVPPAYTFFCVFLLNLLLYLTFRRHIRADWRINTTSAFAAVVVTYALTSLAVNTQRANLQTAMLLLLLLAGLLVLIRWRRELANWLLHLRHPDDERFRLA